MFDAVNSSYQEYQWSNFIPVMTETPRYYSMFKSVYARKSKGTEALCFNCFFSKDLKCISKAKLYHVFMCICMKYFNDIILHVRNIP